MGCPNKICSACKVDCFILNFEMWPTVQHNMQGRLCYTEDERERERQTETERKRERQRERERASAKLTLRLYLKMLR